MPPSKKRGHIVLLMSVGPSICLSVDQMVSDHCLKTFYHRAFIFNMLIGLLFGFTRSKATTVTFVKKCYPFIIMRIIYHKAFIFHMLIGLVEDMTSIDFGFTRVNKVPTVREKFFSRSGNLEIGLGNLKNKQKSGNFVREEC